MGPDFSPVSWLRPGNFSPHPVAGELSGLFRQEAHCSLLLPADLLPADPGAAPNTDSSPGRDAVLVGSQPSEQELGCRAQPVWLTLLLLWARGAGLGPARVTGGVLASRPAASPGRVPGLVESWSAHTHACAQAAEAASENHQSCPSLGFHEGSLGVRTVEISFSSLW